MNGLSDDAKLAANGLAISKGGDNTLVLPFTIQAGFQQTNSAVKLYNQ